MNTLIKLIESGQLVPCFKELKDMNAGVAKVTVQVKGKPAFAIILVGGEEETEEVIAAVQAVEDSWCTSKTTNK